jgi:hypothetical protein
MGLTNDGETEKRQQQPTQQQTVAFNADDALLSLSPDLALKIQNLRNQRLTTPQSKVLAVGESVAIPLNRESLPIEIILSPGMIGSRTFEVLRTESGQWVLRNKTGADDLITLTEGLEVELSRGLVPNMTDCISRKHAKLVAKDGVLLVSDIQSRFGTEVLYQAATPPRA